jgi:hypothetical protein
MKRMYTSQDERPPTQSKEYTCKTSKSQIGIKKGETILDTTFPHPNPATKSNLCTTPFLRPQQTKKGI